MPGRSPVCVATLRRVRWDEGTNPAICRVGRGTVRAVGPSANGGLPMRTTAPALLLVPSSTRPSVITFPVAP
jgi:hypothetical protein